MDSRNNNPDNQYDNNNKHKNSEKTCKREKTARPRVFVWFGIGVAEVDVKVTLRR